MGAEAWARASACSTAPGEHHPVLKQSPTHQPHDHTNHHPHACHSCSLPPLWQDFPGTGLQAHTQCHTLTHAHTRTHTHTYTRTRSKAHRIMAAGSSRYFTE